MTYLGIDTEAARALVGELQQRVQSLEEVQRLVVEAERLSQVASLAIVPLDQVGADWQQTAAEITAAVIVVEAFRLHLPEVGAWSVTPMPGPSRTPVPHEADEGPGFEAASPGATPRPMLDPVSSARAEAAPAAPSTTAARWDASPDTPWNHVHQEASHNSYAVKGGVDALFDVGVRTFELDIHRGPPASLSTMLPWSFVSRSGGSDESTDWWVYHMTGDSSSEYADLRAGLEAVAALDTSEPLTIFVDNKDAFGGLHTAERFDEVLEASLGDRLYRPIDFEARAPQASSLHEVVDLAGWPTVRELDGRIMVVITDRVESYGPADPAAFVAGSTARVRSVAGGDDDDDGEHIFYNANSRAVTVDDIATVRASGGVLRTYFNPLCAQVPFGADPSLPNYRAIDVEPGSVECAPTVFVPPVDTPVPIPDAAD